MYLEYLIALCEDDAMVLKINVTYILKLKKKYCLDIQVAHFTNGMDLLEYSKDNSIDIAFLDIGMKPVNGIDIAKRLLEAFPNIATIFITGHKEFALDAYQVEAMGYIPKPIDPAWLERVFVKAIKQVNAVKVKRSVTPLVIVEDNQKKKVRQLDIRFIEKDQAQSILYMKKSTHAIYESITSIIKRLEPNFIRINQSTIVNLDYVSELRNHEIKMKTGESFVIGRTYIKNVKELYWCYGRM